MTTLALNKPYGVLSRFTPDGSAHRPLSTLGLPAEVYPAGRLDADSEGLLILTSDKPLVDRLLSPKHAHEKTYHVQVERIPDDAALNALRNGVVMDGKITLPAKAKVIDDPSYPARDPPVRFRKSVPTAWVELVITEGRNRQVRRMTAAVGHPTLRLVRAKVGGLGLGDLVPGAWKELSRAEIERLLA